MAKLLPARIQERLDTLNLTALAASTAAGLGRTAVSDILSGKSKNPSFETIIALTRVLRCSTMYLTGEADTPTDPNSALQNYYIDFQLTQLSGHLEVEVFRSTEAKKEPSQEYPVYDHPEYLDWSVSLYRMNDSSMEGLGIYKGDFITVASPNDGIIPFGEGSIVLTRRILDQRNYEEISIRCVQSVDGEAVRLAAIGSDGPFSEVEFDISSAYEAIPNWYHNEDGTVAIEGIACRVSRDLPRLKFGFIQTHT